MHGDRGNDGSPGSRRAEDRGRVRQAADQVEYSNGTATTPMGRKRAENGHVEPYRVKCWQIGNELGDEKHQLGLAAFCQAMKAVDPSIRLMAAFPSPGLFERAGRFIDYICPHHYGCRDLPARSQMDFFGTDTTTRTRKS